ncbi:hypothetical protein OZX65_01575 [Leuconostocaceae bacterium ESL0723]|nr:hypothetical protein OZX65_01575 [Leuconostocaceae bacterium ESL0723]
MFKYLFKDITPAVSDGEYRKILIWRSVWIGAFSVLLYVAGVLSMPVTVSTGFRYFAAAIGALGMASGFVLSVVLTMLMKPNQLHQNKIKASDERRQLNNTRALRYSYLVFLFLMYIPMFYCINQRQYVIGIMIGIVMLVSLVFYFVTWALLNKYA